MSSPSGALQGAQHPRVFSAAAEAVSSAGAEAVELAAMAGLNLDPWQQFVLEHSLAERADGTWAASRVGLVVPRQNGKGSILEARELAGLFLLGERLIVHSAHQFDTSLEAFNRLLALLEETPDLEKRVRRVSRSHGDEGIYLKGGQRIRFRTRTTGGGRGFTADCLILDEAMILPEAMLAALLPTLSARPNPQVWYTGSAVDQNTHEHGVVLSRIRLSGHADDNPRLAYFEWGLDFETPEDVPESVAADPVEQAKANPGFGIRLEPETIESEKSDLDTRSFAVERLGVGDWHRLDGDGSVISAGRWLQLVDPESKSEGSECYVFDVSPSRSHAALAKAGIRADGLKHVEIVQIGRGTAWLAPKLAEIKISERPREVFCDGVGPAASLVPELEQAGVEITTVNSTEHGQACGMLFDAVEQGTVRHLGTPEMTSAIKGAAQRPLGEAWAWSRKNSSVDITPLVASTLAHWAISKFVEGEILVAYR